MDATEIFGHNRSAWDREVERGNKWTEPVSPEVIQRARQGDWELLLTPVKPVPRSWFGELKGARVLCLASGGGQQGPILAAAGALVTVLDASPKQLERDREVASRDRLGLSLVEGDMADLSCFPQGAFELVFNPVSTCFVPDVRRVWAEVARVLRPGGALLTGFCNPALYLFDDAEVEATGQLLARYRLPYSDIDQLPPERLRHLIRSEQNLEFSHSLADQIGGQLEAGLVLTDLYEDRFEEEHPISDHLPTMVATRAVKHTAPRGNVATRP